MRCSVVVALFSETAIFSAVAASCSPASGFSASAIFSAATTGCSAASEGCLWASRCSSALFSGTAIFSAAAALRFLALRRGGSRSSTRLDSSSALKASISATSSRVRRRLGKRGMRFRVLPAARCSSALFSETAIFSAAAGCSPAARFWALRAARCSRRRAARLGVSDGVLASAGCLASSGFSASALRFSELAGCLSASRFCLA